MTEFKRSPSKVWWASESLEWREVSGSPGSQDSGFSDTEIPPQIHKTSSQKPENLTSNYQEKSTPDKLQIPGTPRKYCRNSPKVIRSLFGEKNTHQYSAIVETNGNIQRELQYSLRDIQNTSCRTKKIVDSEVLNKSAPAVLEELNEEEEDDVIINHSLSSDCESELECLFNGQLDSPKHTSTPKNVFSRMRSWRRSLLQKERRTIQTSENVPVQKWISEIQHNYEQECMTTLQAKSISADLHQKVSKMATFTMTRINNILSHANCLKQEYKTLNREKKHIGPLAQSLAGNILDFFRTYSEISLKMAKQYDTLRKESCDEALPLISTFFTQWELNFHEVLEQEVKKLVERLEKPCSEMDLRATLTGITSLCLHHDNLVEIFTKNDVIPILLILCEKCEGSSIRSLLFRALSTMCCTSYAIRQFEKYSGIQIVTDTLSEEASRPEPEKSEAVALLAQVTAPWIEDNYTIKNLSEYSKKLVKNLTKFVAVTKCCQNLLLCAAALANLSSMDQKSIKYMLHQNSAEVLLNSVNKRGPSTSVYFLEQVAMLIANMSALDSARQQLVTLPTIPILLCFLKTGNYREDVEKRLQQKAIIALSRLCSLNEAAKQIVDAGGMEKLVKMCREKDERFCNDAVLVATLATLRKIVEACGRDVISNEDAQELVEPKLLDSFLAYSSQSESYV